MKRTELLPSLAKKELLNNKIQEEYPRHYEDGRLEHEKWDLKSKIPRCAISVYDLQKTDLVARGDFM